MKTIILAPDSSVSLKERFPHSPYSTWKDDTVEYVFNALKSRGFDPEVLECRTNLLDELGKRDKALVFNLCDDGFENRSETEPLVAGILEFAGFPYIGSDMTTLAIAQNKRMCKELMKANGIRTPEYWYVETEEDLKGIKAKGRLIVKPNAQHGSIGINESSVVDSKKALEAQVKRTLKDYGPALVEEFIAGREFIIGTVGDEILPPAEVISPNRYNLKDEHIKWNIASEGYRGLRIECRKVEPKMEGQMRRKAIAMRDLLDCRDYSRYDFRVDSRGRCYLIDINPNPGLSSDSSLAFIMKSMGRTYDDLIHDIVKSALRRYEKGGNG